MLDSWINYAEGFILVYAIDDKDSFDLIKTRYQRIMKNKIGENPAIIIVGNKCDLDDKRQVETRDGEILAKGLNVNFIEVSALEKINVKETFLTVAKQLLVKKAKISLRDEVEIDNKKRCYCF